MPNTAQQEFLDSLVGSEGIYFATIRDSESFNLGTKILYLERAISQDCQTFLQSLDKLYRPSLTLEARTANLEFIRALKSINDLCFNNEVKYGEFGITESLSHYFGSLGNVDANDFKTAVEGIIRAEINGLRQGHEPEVVEQSTARITEEDGITRQTGWRAEMDLPQGQLAPSNHAHHLAFFRPARAQAPLLPVGIQILIGAGAMTQATAAALSREQVEKLVFTQPLISTGRMSVEDALALTGEQHHRLGEERVITLIEQDRLAIDQVKGLSREQVQKLVCTQPLISNGRMSVEDALALTGVQPYNLRQERIIALIEQDQLTIEEAKNLSLGQVDILVFTQPLISTGQMSVVDALALTGMQHICLGQERVIALIQEGRLTVEQAKDLSQEQIDSINLGDEHAVLDELHRPRGFNNSY